MPTRTIVLGCVLALIVVSIAGTIEWLNVQAGGRLPNREYRNGDPADGVVKWRGSTIITETFWRKYRGPKDEQGEPVARPLTAEEEGQMRSEIAEARANNRLRDVVSSVGLMQYLLVPWLLWVGVVVVRGGRWRHGVVMLVVAAGAGGLMFYRAYFTSLGW